jgi:hypothetical protein
MAENEPVEDSEFVYRRIHANFYDAALAIPIGPEAFRPTRNDVSGISVFRARFAGPTDTLPLDPEKAKTYYVAQLLVGDIHRLGLMVVPEPVFTGPSGHAVIPELSWQAYQTDKKRLKPIQHELARLGSARIVFRPPHAQQS